MNLQFGNPVFHRGINVTVRRGDKWLRNYLQGVRDVVLTDKDDKPVGEGFIQEVAYMPFNMVGVPYLGKEHDPSCVTYNGLLQGMRAAYGEDFSEDESVTVIQFYVKE